MRGASRASLAEARQRLSGATASAAGARTLGEELFAILGVLDAQPGLRRALTDSTRPPGDRSDLARRLLRGRVADTTLDFFASLAGARWSESGDLPDATEQLGVMAIAAAAERGQHLDDLEDQLFRFSRVVAGSPDLRTALSNPDVPSRYKVQLLDTLLEGKVDADSRRLIDEAAVHPRGRSVDVSLSKYAQLAAQWRQRLIAVVRVAVELTAGQRERLVAVLQAAYGHEIHLDVVVDPRVQGGISVQIGDELIDGSVASRLATLRRRLAA